jgi:soluble lytic murein transglycosylase-like protein
MSVEGISASALGASEAAGALDRVQRLQELVGSVADAATPEGESSFAAALQAASAEGGAPPEAPEPGEGLPGEGLEDSAEPAGFGEEAGASGIGEGATSLSGGTAAEATATSAYSPYLSAESSATDALASTAIDGGEAEPYATSPYGASPYEASASDYSGGDYLDTSLGDYAEATSTGAASAPSDSGSSAVGESAYSSLIAQEANRNGVEPALLQGLIEQESGFDPNAESGAGAQGLTQLMPSTAASLGVNDPFDPQQSIAGGAKLLGQLLHQFGGNVSDALAAYNAGAGAVQEYGGVPPYPETEAYVAKVLANAQGYRGGSG